MPRAGNQQTKASLWKQQPVMTPERKLWRAVLEQAYLDAELAKFSDGADSIEGIRAQRYLRADSSFEAENLGLVCDYAELPADRIYLWARRRYPAEQTFEDHECGGSCPEPSRRAPPLFLPPGSYPPDCSLRR